MNKLDDENEDIRNRLMQSTFIFRGVPENKQSDRKKTSHDILSHCYQVD